MELRWSCDGAAMELRWSCDGAAMELRWSCNGAAMSPLCILAKRGAVRVDHIALRNDLEAWPDSSGGRALDVQTQGSQVRIPLGSVIFSHFHFSVLLQ